VDRRTGAPPKGDTVIRGIPAILALAAVRAMFAWPLAGALAEPVVERAVLHPRGESALLEHGAVLLLDVLRDPTVDAPSTALVLALSAGVALTSLVPTSWLVTAVANPRMSAREAFLASLPRVPDLAFAWGLTALLVAALAAVGARLAGTVLAAEPALPPLSLRTAAVVAVALGPAALASPWADVVRVRAVVLGGDPLDDLRFAVRMVARWGIARAWATWAAFVGAELVVTGALLSALAFGVTPTGGDRAAPVVLAVLVAVAVLAPPALRSLWFSRIVERTACGRALEVHEGLPPSPRLE
jgi:hypothetical protein